MIEGYKVFNKGLVNNYGMHFLEHQDYQVDKRKQEIKYGLDGYGFHFVKRLEDGLRYFDSFNKDVDIAKVVALGDVKESFDDYYGYYDLYVTDHIFIDHVLTREEIIDYIKGTSIMQIERFVANYKLTDKEIATILKDYPCDKVKNAINYYQYKDYKTYTKYKK